MKKFVLKVLLLVIFCLLITSTMCIIIDPYNVFRWNDVKDNGVEVNKNYVKMKYILNNKDKFDTFIFGSSRVGNIHPDKYWDGRCYNMTYSQAVPKEILLNIKTLISSGVKIKKIFLGVDSLSYTIDYKDHINDPMMMQYETIQSNPFKFYLTYLNPSMVFKAYNEIISKHNEDIYYGYRFYEFGFNSDYTKDQLINYEGFENIYVGNKYLLDETLKDIEDIVNLCKDNDISLTVFVNPMSKNTFLKSYNDLNFKDFLIGLANICDYYNFSGINDITTEPSNWIDGSHYDAFVSDMVLECIGYNAYYENLYEQGFGQLVTKNNIDSIISLIESNINKK